MSIYDELLAETEPHRRDFMAIPIVARVLAEGADRETYLDFLEQAYHHVKHTCRLLALALSRCGDADARYAAALVEYLQEERGHEAWILDDIRALSGDAARVAAGAGALPTRSMVAYVHYAILHDSPYAMLSMVHVLEGLSATLATAAAAMLQASLGGEAGLTYLRSHGQLDRSHVEFFRALVDGVTDPPSRRAIVDTAKAVYRLYGDIFREIESQAEARRRAA